jgi:HD-like signal output (HDOD) protein
MAASPSPNGDSAESPVLRAALKKAERLQVFPPIAAKIQAIAENPDSTVKDLEEVVSLDAALSARILSLANSPLLGLSRSVATLRHALFLLGLDMVRGIALGLAAVSMQDANKPFRRQIWWHSIRTASATRILLNQAGGRAAAGEGFIVGLLHDIGKLILLEIDEARYAPLLQQHRGDSRLAAAEQEVFDFDHAQLGAACLRRWNLPPATCVLIERHHIADFAGEQALAAAALHVANRSDNELSADVDSTEIVAQMMTDPAAEILGLDAPSLAYVFEKLRDEADSVAALAKSS